MLETKVESRIAGILGSLMDSFSEGKYIDQTNTFDNVDEEQILHVLEDLRQIIFQGFFANKRIKVFTTRNNISMLLEDILYVLARQIARVLPYEEAVYGGICDEDIQEKALDLTLTFLEKLPEIRSVIETDLEAFFDGDPAAFNKDEIIYSYPGLYAIFTNRVAHELYLLGIPIIPRMMTEYAHRETGIDINPGATIGKYFFIDHGTGIVIGETTVIGDHVKVYQGVTIGALSTRAGQQLRGKKRHPTIESNVTIYSGASILGGETVIGEGAVIGSNAFITSSIKPGARVSIQTRELVINDPEEKDGSCFETV